MRDMLVNKFSIAIFVMGIFSWGILAHEIWVRIFRSANSGHENSVKKNRSTQFELIEGSGRYVDLERKPVGYKVTADSLDALVTKEIRQEVQRLLNKQHAARVQAKAHERLRRG